MTGTCIINPKWFYWLSVCDGLRYLFLIIAILCVGVFAGFLIKALYEADYCNWESEEVQKPLKTSIKWIILAFILFVVFIFIPSKSTLIEMQVARFATYENAEWTVDAIKSAVDYIIESIKSLK